MIELRPYQAKTVNDVRAVFARKVQKVLLCSPTGSGKTIMFAYIAAGAVIKKNRVLILAHKHRIIAQISATLEKFGIAHGIIAPGHPSTEAQVQVGMVQTVARRRLASFQSYDLLIVDEAHHYVSATFKAVLDHFSSAKLLGVTATPERLDGRGLGDIFDEMVEGPPTKWLIDNGFLARFRYFAPESDIDLSALRGRSTDPSMEVLERAVAKSRLVGDVVDHYERWMSGRQTIVFCISILEAEKTAVAFLAAGWPADVIHGKQTTDEQDAVFAAFESRSIKLIVVVDMASEGVDIPACSAIIMARPSWSFGMVKQMWGRPLRLKPDGSDAIIVDPVANWERHGLPDDPHAWSLTSNKRKTKAPDEVHVHVCARCFRTVDADAALDCDAPDCPLKSSIAKARELKRVKGELVEITAQREREAWAWAGDIDPERGRLSDLVDAASGDRARLEMIRAKRKYKMGWLYKMLGVKPRWAAKATR